VDTREQAVRAFMAEDYPGLVRYLWRLVGDEEAARDLAQETVVRLFGRWRDIEEPRAYAYTTATNLARRSWSRRSTEQSALRRLFGRAEPAVPGPQRDVQDAVERLPAKWRDVVLLHYFADLPVSDVARRLDLPEGTVRRQLHEARHQLALALGDAR
jgi:DNA-directed RNA polymerase specialized sigma24 family protein